MKNFILAIVLFLTNTCYVHSEMPIIRVLYTAALIDFCYNSRKDEYVKSLQVLKDYGVSSPYIVEAIQSGPYTFFDEYSVNVVYSNVNDERLNNKGVNEAKSMRKCISQSEIESLCNLGERG